MNRFATFCCLVITALASTAEAQDMRKYRVQSSAYSSAQRPRPSATSTVPARLAGTPRPAKTRARPATNRVVQDPVYDDSTYADPAMDESEVIVQGGEMIHEGVILDGDAYHGDAYHDDSPMMYDADGFEESYGVYNECGSCDGHGCGSCGVGNPFGLDLCNPGGDLPGRQLCICLPSHGWVSVDYLGLFASGMNMPALVTSSPAGSPQSVAGVLPGANVLYGGNDNAFSSQINGIRVRVGIWSAVRPNFGVEGEYFGFNEIDESFSASSSGSPILARPFYNNMTGLQDAELVAFPNLLSGNVQVEATSRLDAAAVRFRHILCCGEKGSCSPWDCSPLVAQSRIDATLGWRYMQLVEGLTITEDLSSLSPNNPGSFLIRDDFQTFNQFNGVEFGFQWLYRKGFWSLDALMRTSVGVSRQWLQIEGTTRSPRDGAAQAGGLLAQPGRNIGVYDRNELGVVPEFGTTLGYQLTERLKLNFGYTSIYWSNVLRPGDQIDNTVNTNLLPPVIAGSSYMGQPFAVKEVDYWVHGFTAGIEYRW
ncbi:MAG: BBP7 family outer membrane beta-barrel protein [Pirellula sp.]